MPVRAVDISTHLLLPFLTHRPIELHMWVVTIGALERSGGKEKHSNDTNQLQIYTYLLSVLALIALNEESAVCQWAEVKLSLQVALASQFLWSLGMDNLPVKDESRHFSGSIFGAFFLEKVHVSEVLRATTFVLHNHTAFNLSVARKGGFEFFFLHSLVKVPYPNWVVGCTTLSLTRLRRCHHTTGTLEKAVVPESSSMEGGRAQFVTCI